MPAADGEQVNVRRSLRATSASRPALPTRFQSPGWRMLARVDLALAPLIRAVWIIINDEAGGRRKYLGRLWRWTFAGSWLLFLLLFGILDLLAGRVSFSWVGILALLLV